ELVPKHDDFEFLELVRPNAQNHEIEKPAKQRVAQRHEHGGLSIAGRWPNSYAAVHSDDFCRPGQRDRIRVYAPFTFSDLPSPPSAAALLSVAEGSDEQHLLPFAIGCLRSCPSARSDRGATAHSRHLLDRR